MKLTRSQNQKIYCISVAELEISPDNLEVPVIENQKIYNYHLEHRYIINLGKLFCLAIKPSAKLFLPIFSDLLNNISLTFH